jgi:glycosyltransferase involved in cell wall biosynthesis
VVSFTGLAAAIRRHSPGARVREWGHAALFTPAGGGEQVRGELGLPADTPVVLYSGTFERYQGLPLLLDAVPAVRARHPRATFVLLGADGKAGQEMRREVAERGLDDAVRVLDRQPQERLPGFLAMADVLVSPRLYGGNTPLKSYDYLAAGRPIIATDIPAHRAVLTDRTALLVRPDAEALAEGIAGLLAEPARARELAEGAREYAASALRWPAFVERVGAMYGELCGSPVARVRS